MTLVWSTSAPPRAATLDLTTPANALMLPCQWLNVPAAWAGSLFAVQQYKQLQSWPLPLVTVAGGQRIQGTVRLQANGLPTRVLQQNGLERDGPTSNHANESSVQSWVSQPRAWRYTLAIACPA